jgi:hypothetical protein
LTSSWTIIDYGEEKYLNLDLATAYNFEFIYLQFSINYYRTCLLGCYWVGVVFDKDHDVEDRELGNGRDDLKIVVQVFAQDQELKSTTKPIANTLKKKSGKGKEYQ